MAGFDIRNFEAVAFDFDGTLADTVKVHTASRREAYAQMAKEKKDSRYADVPDEVHDTAHLYGSHPDEINAWILNQAGIIDELDADDVAVKELCELKQAIYHDKLKDGLEEQPGAVDFVRRAMARKPGKLAIVTTAQETEVMPYLVRYRLNRYFPAARLITRNTAGVVALKPATDAYDVARKNLNVTHPSLVLAIEDSEHGIESAGNAGMTVAAIATTRSYETLASLGGSQQPHIVAHDFAELRDICKLN